MDKGLGNWSFASAFGRIARRKRSLHVGLVESRKPGVGIERDSAGVVLLL